MSRGNATKSFEFEKKNATGKCGIGAPCAHGDQAGQSRTITLRGTDCDAEMRNRHSRMRRSLTLSIRLQLAARHRRTSSAGITNLRREVAARAATTSDRWRTA